MDIRDLHHVIRSGNFEWRKHTLIRLSEHGIAQNTILEVILSGEIIEDYPYSKPFPSCLIFKMLCGKPHHVVIGFDPVGKRGYIITAYNPTLDKFEADFKTRRR